MKFKTIVAAISLCAGATFSANAQTSQLPTLNLNPKIIAEANCNGIIFGNALWGYLNGTLSEARARTMAKATYLGFFLNAIQIENMPHLREFAVEYDSVFQDGLQGVMTAVENGGFNWEYQAEIDKCTARLLSPLVDVPLDDLKENGVNDYFAIVSALNEYTDKNFDFILQIYKAAE